jgi:hypothetical protein
MDPDTELIDRVDTESSINLIKNNFGWRLPARSRSRVGNVDISGQPMKCKLDV